MCSDIKSIEETLVESYPNINIKQYIWQALIKNQALGVGWHDLIIELIEKIEQIYKERNVDVRDFIINEITKKYGALRFIIDSRIGEVFELVTEYENKSEKICEECGAAGRLRHGKCIQTLCDSCYEIRKVIGEI